MKGNAENCKIYDSLEEMEKDLEKQGNAVICHPSDAEYLFRPAPAPRVSTKNIPVQLGDADLCQIYDSEEDLYRDFPDIL